MSTPEISREKKRIRDRRAQIARRARQNTHLTELGSIAAHCQKHHNESELQKVNAAIDTLRAENADLRRRQTAAVNLLTGTAAIATSFNLSTSTPPSLSTDVGDGHWLGLPLHTPHGEQTSVLLPWLLYPAIVRDASDIPSGIEIMYGSEINPLANSIHVAMVCARFSTMTDPERLAFGWLMYVYVKWLFDPTSARFALLPSFWRPTELQKTQAHPAVLDFVLWPDIRDNMIRTYAEDSPEMVIALRCLAPELIEAWPRITPVLQPDKTRLGEYIMNADFMATFTNLDSWTLSPQFIERYPALVKASKYKIREP